MEIKIKNKRCILWLRCKQQDWAQGNKQAQSRNTGKEKIESSWKNHVLHVLHILHVLAKFKIFIFILFPSTAPELTTDSGGAITH